MKLASYIVRQCLSEDIELSLARALAHCTVTFKVAFIVLKPCLCWFFANHQSAIVHYNIFQGCLPVTPVTRPPVTITKSGHSVPTAQLPV
jgi:hypothetical protein